MVTVCDDSRVYACFKIAAILIHRPVVSVMVIISSDLVYALYIHSKLT